MTGYFFIKNIYPSNNMSPKVEAILIDATTHIDFVKESTDPVAIETAGSPTIDIERLETAFARDAVSRIFKWLENDSVNSPDYLTSAAYTAPRAWLESNAIHIQHQIQEDLAHLTTEHIEEDVVTARDVYDPNHHKTHINMANGQLENTAKIFDASDFMYAGIEEVMQEAGRLNPEVTIEATNQRSVRAIGAMVVRHLYLEILASETPAVLTVERMDTISAVFKQNILSAVRHIALLEQRASRLASATESPTEVSPAQQDSDISQLAA